MALRVAIVGATGNVGRELFNIMDERNFPADKVHAVASRRSIGRKCSYGDKTILYLDSYDQPRAVSHTYLELVKGTKPEQHTKFCQVY
ncbi:MAG: hypothetical protein VXW22_10200, partial [Pseudomonadota bacterium]|nr:hypothetical protein [Pseudomonadota bacterium]